MAQRLPLIVILGATACGKSRLAIELARRFGGEIISADSMQIYNGLDIVTNKVTIEERTEAKHHMIDFLKPTAQYSVVDFRDRSVEIIKDLMNKNRLPIVVGGTNYYIESILWSNFLVECPINSNDHTMNSSDDGRESMTLFGAELEAMKKVPQESLHSKSDFQDLDIFFSKRIYADSFQGVPAQDLWNILEKVDPKSANMTHPNDRRKIIRWLQIYQSHKKSYSSVVEAMNKSGQREEPSLGGPLRFDRTCILWIDCEKEILSNVMDNRVDQMLERGLLAELEKFHKDYNIDRIADGQKPNYSRGIFQTIGFKEFHDYLMLDADVKASEKGKRILEASIRSMKTSTRRYAKRQIKWIRNRLLHMCTRDLPPLYRLTTSLTDEDEWRANVGDPALKIVQSFIDDQSDCDIKPEAILSTTSSDRNVSIKKYCEACDRIIFGSAQVADHFNSKFHHHRMRIMQIKKERLANKFELDGQKDCEDTKSKVNQ